MTPSLPDAVKSSLVAYIESDVFGGSNRMAIEDVALALSDAVVVAIPGTCFEASYLIDVMGLCCIVASAMNMACGCRVRQVIDVVRVRLLRVV